MVDLSLNDPQVVFFRLRGCVQFYPVAYFLIQDDRQDPLKNRYYHYNLYGQATNSGSFRPRGMLCRIYFKANLLYNITIRQ